MKVALLNDTSKYHCGCAAVISVLEKQIQEAGGTITARLLSEEAYGNVLINPMRWAGVDVIIINGEGSMHHGSGGNILKSVVPHIGKKKIFLVNSVWDGQPQAYADIISKFDAIFAREMNSADNMTAQGVPAAKIGVFPDLCVQADVNTITTAIDFRNNIAKTNSFLSWGAGPETTTRELNIKSYDWSYFVESIRTAKAIYTGLHHGMFACIKARTPFVVFKHNCCKIQGVLDYFNVDGTIRIVTDPKDLEGAMADALQNIDVYEQLFAAVANHPEFELKDYIN